MLCSLSVASEANKIEPKCCALIWGHDNKIIVSNRNAGNAYKYQIRILRGK